MPPVTFDDLVARWHEFYVLSGTAAATLMGLLFVSLSLHVETLRRDPRNQLERVARSAFTSFLIVLFIALLLLSPDVQRRPLATALIAIGLIRLVMVVSELRRSFAPGGRADSFSRGHLTVRTVIPIAAFVMLLLAGGTLAARNLADGLAFLMMANVLLLADASRSAWDLLVGVGRRPGAAAK
jgi:hypothetical protein